MWEGVVLLWDGAFKNNMHLGFGLCPPIINAHSTYVADAWIRIIMFG